MEVLIRSLEAMQVIIVEYARCPLKAHGNSLHLTISINKVSIEKLIGCSREKLY